MTDRSRYETPLWVTVEWETFRALMRKRRVDQGLRQEDVALAMGRSKDYVSVLENHASIPNMVTAMLWVAALGGTLRPEFPVEQEE